MLTSWLQKLPYDPIEPLVNHGSEAITYFIKRDLVGESVDSIESIWGLNEAQVIFKKQDSKGYWKSSSVFFSFGVPPVKNHHDNDDDNNNDDKKSL